MRILIPIFIVLFHLTLEISSLQAEVFITQEDALLNGRCVNNVDVKYIGDAGPCTLFLYKLSGNNFVL